MTGAGDDPLIGFRVGDAGAALPLAIVREVTERPRVVRVPGSHGFVSGVVLHEGMALPVYDLRRLDSLWIEGARPDPAVDPDRAERLIVCDWGETTLGLLGEHVDLVEEDRGGPGREDEGGRCGMKDDFVRRVLLFRGEAIALLDTDKLFGSLGVPAVEPRGRREAGEDDPARG